MPMQVSLRRGTFADSCATGLAPVNSNGLPNAGHVKVWPAQPEIIETV